ncbi:MAG: phosphoribosylformylglycinamidine cyclo-ligase [Chloroflexota bacterium]|nr:phosphoribosylformylglycinamidine cyclo-ligase [Chloroflexota bacterium]
MGAVASTYRQAGVDIDAGARTVGLMRAAVRGTFGPNVLADLGHFGGLYALDPNSENGPVLVASADGVGTKLKLAFVMGTHRLVGHDIVNHCINDILACGARPLFFLDYVASGKLVPEQTAEVVTGMAEACRAAGCALLGGETAEMPGMYAAGEYDVAGFIVGMVQRDRILLGHDIEPGDVVLALPSNGLHTNGYSLAREVLRLNGEPDETRERLAEYNEMLGTTLAEALTRPHTSYLNSIAPLLDLPERPIKSMAHITGGGLLDNIPRVLPEGCAVELDTGAWDVPPIFRLIQQAGSIEQAEMARVFNMGLGMVLIVSPDHAALVESRLPEVIRAGRVVAWEGGERVSLDGEQ